MIIQEQNKLCHKCGKIKPFDQLGSDAQKVDGKCWWCKDCIAKAHSRRYNLRKQGRSATLAKFPNE